MVRDFTYVGFQVTADNNTNKGIKKEESTDQIEHTMHSKDIFGQTIFQEIQNEEFARL